jgi:hypothetical protein
MTNLYEEADRLLALANKKLSIYTEDKIVRDDGHQLEREHVLGVPAVFNGRGVWVEFVETDGVPEQYRYNVRVFDAETREQLGVGNGGADWGEAFDIYHWRDLTN